MLSPEEIRARTFLVSLRGYDREEVQAFLDQVASELALLRERLEAAEGAAQDLPTAADIVAEADGERPVEDEAGAHPFAEIGQETQRILEAAQTAGQELRRRAQEDADRELKAARAQATRLIADAERRRDDIEGSVRALEEARAGLAGDLRGVGRTIERLLRELVPAEEATTTVRAALAEAARAGSADAGRDRAPVEEQETAGAQDATSADVGAEPGPDGAEVLEAGPAEPEAGAGPTGLEAAAADAGEPAAEAAAAPEPAHAVAPAEPEVETEVGPETEAAVPEPATPAPEPSAGAPTPQRSSWTLPERVPVQARGEALAPSHPKLVRRLKRGLQDIENALLDRLRGAGDDLDVEALLPDADAATGLAELAQGHLTNAYAVGYHAGASAVGQGAGDPPDRTHDLPETLAAEVVQALADALRTRVSAPQGGADAQAVADDVDAAFGEVRDGFVREASAVALIRAYEWGQHDAWSSAGIAGRKWALATEPECGDPRCEDNAGSGAVPLDEPFPSGHEVPPLRAGCSCTTVPLVSRS